MIDVETINEMTRMAIKGLSFEETGLDSNKKDFYDRLMVDIEKHPEKAMISPVNEWADDKYDDFLAKYEKTRKSRVLKKLGIYEISKAEGERRYTLGAMYIPNIEDAHGEWTDADELQKAVWEYVRKDDRRIRLQHNRDVIAGEWLEIMSFPYSLTVPIKSPEGVEKEHTYPAHTVFLGVVWEPWAWQMVKDGKIRGYSIGGKAERLFVDMDVEKGDPTVSDVHVDTIMNPKKKPKGKDE
jgi:hypothetical protein